MVNNKDLKSMSLERLAELVDLYPWFAGARKELCLRTGKLADASLWIGERSILHNLAAQGKGYAATAGDVKRMLKPDDALKKKVVVVGGDFFSQAQYDNVGKSGVESLGRIKNESRQPQSLEAIPENLQKFCTETLAQIYTEQGYYEQAKYIYSQLSLLYPEKNTYFAALIENLDKEITN